jgi:poly(3-hydroxybutyrate) depolymerase
MPEWFVGRTTHSINASELMWDFFRNHPLPRPRVSERRD